MQSYIKGKILEIILEKSAVACQLDSSASSLRHTEVTTVPVTAMLTVRDSDLATQRVFQEFE